MEQVNNTNNTNKNIIDNNNIQKTRSAKAFKFNPFDKEFHVNPYPTYYRLRSEDPVHRYFVGGDWVLGRYADVKAVLRSGRVRTHDQPELIQQKNLYLQGKGKNLNVLAYTSNKLLFYMNPPDHSRLRSLVVKAFSPTVVERMRPRIQEIVNDLLGPIHNKGTMDIIADLAGPLPVTVISKMLGIPNEAQDQLHQWSNVFSRILDSLVSLEEYEVINKVIEDFQEYLRNLVAEREKDPQQDLISDLIAAREQGERLSQEELLATCILLFMTGEETTVNTIGNGMLALLSHPEQMETLKREPTMIQNAVEEILRYDSPVQMTNRIAIDNIEIGNQTIKTGEKIILCLGSANRDPAQFPDPDQFNINRCQDNHLAFGDGIHSCLGSALARAQAQIAINTLVQQFPDLKLVPDKLEWRKNIALRGLKTLPVTFTCR
ncbi:cytochrome P450 [Brasilonema sp. UFV-L1]|uniref:cytochrome P450 n=1 Tax=Brasilonema sp. UFV-L1 TaxID=2234130 RepID=UPI00145D0020|nr:cytochrome P450 [Brasilonema sp. UFV-L1]NMG07495.1 cytochrome P450 [Brasilonema sp. UFV-L1]